ncbi:hypothetical protein ALC60_06002 [Trachymyrmex zeteki]|uniref:Uncharacterized protein n=1 Tax=Mycetomoellerius zeteki TaxID=64791 RepID=A0A151X4E9_9HYME|nr:hypothetical protein ALC60_06002 [Trachymyrmex zeteki]
MNVCSATISAAPGIVHRAGPPHPRESARHQPCKTMVADGERNGDRDGAEGSSVRTTERIAERRQERKRERAGFASRQTAPGRCKGEGVRSWKISMYPSWRHDVSLNLALRVWSAAPPPGNRDSLRRGRSNLSAGIGGGFGPGFGFRSREIDPRVGVSWVIAPSQPPVARGASKRRWCESWLRLGERTLSRYDVALICSKQVSAAAGPWVGCGVASGGTEEDDTAPEDGPADGIANLHAS